MATRVRLKRNLFFETPSTVERFHSGSTVLDCALGGGWAAKRIINLVGDKSTGKTLLAIEAAANFKLKYPKARIRYVEGEAAFDQAYADQLGVHIDSKDFIDDIRTIEALEKDLLQIIKGAVRETLYIVDSLDSLSDIAELARDPDSETGSYGTAKAKKLSEMFRKTVKDMSESKVTLLVISQVRDKVGVRFGKKTTRSGGRALDFYASQIVELAQVGRIVRTINKVKRAIGINVVAKVEKNKTGMPFRQADFPILFAYGIDEVSSCLNFLESVGELGKLDLKPANVDKYRQALSTLGSDEYNQELRDIRLSVTGSWAEIENLFKVKRKKYGAT